MEAEEYLSKLGQKIRELRTKKGLSQQELASRIGTKHTQIGRIERGEANVTIGMLGRIADEFKISIVNLINIGKK